MIDAGKLDTVRETLAADGYLLDVREADGRVAVAISATPDACEDCLVPKPLMADILRDALGVDTDAIDLTYPND
ncbi:MAG: hypothetical protein J2P15_14335 [Micromonosporaceae bacterium]|nr:hypothetical protein [Micromonosporaceae bacterium]